MMWEGPSFRTTPIAKSTVGQPHPHLLTTRSLGICHLNLEASGRPLSSSQSSRRISVRDNGLSSGMRDIRSAMVRKSTATRILLRPFQHVLRHLLSPDNRWLLLSHAV